MLLYSVTSDIVASTALWFIKYYLPERLTELNNVTNQIGQNVKKFNLLTYYLNSELYSTAVIALIIAIVINSLVLIYSIYNIWQILTDRYYYGDY
jgi:hypothetical protein